jgi:hypothetical protein
VTVVPASDALWTVPELGPSLGRLVDPPATSPGALRVPLDDIRITLVTGVFDLAGASRSFAAAGDREGAVASLGRVAWLQLWEKAVAAVAGRIAGEANAALRHSAEESRFPQRRLRSLTLDDEDVRAIAARLGSGGGPFVAALDALEQAGHVSGARAREAEAGARGWQAALGATARRLESAWLALEQTAEVEQARLAAQIGMVRGWHRPTWPVWVITAVVLAGAGYLGLVLGGYLPVPPPLQGLAAFWWSRL